MKLNIRVENWNGHAIRFIEKSQDDWWAIAKDVTVALGYSQTQAMTKHLKSKYLTSSRLDGMNAKITLINEQGIYKAVTRSQRPEAEEFEDWIFNMIKILRKSSGLEGFQIFRMLDREHQKETMSKLSQKLDNPVRVDFIKANTIANKAVSSMNKHPKMLKKEQMTPDMLIQRQRVLDDVVDLMALTDKFDIGISVSDTIYSKYVN